MVQTRQPTIDHAMTSVEQEIDIVETEREAFDRFLSRVRNIQTTQPGVPESSNTEIAVLVSVGTVPSRGREAVRAAYRETVMAVPHYEREYGETLAENVAAELGATLARPLVTRQSLTPAIHTALVEAAEQGRDNRTDFLRSLRRERDSLQNVERELSDIDTRVVELDERISAASTSADRSNIDESLRILERRCSDLAASRQEIIHSRSVRTDSGVTEDSLVQYLYADMETVTPGLRDIASRLTDIRTQRERCPR